MMTVSHEQSISGTLEEWTILELWLRSISYAEALLVLAGGIIFSGRSLAAQDD